MDLPAEEVPPEMPEPSLGYAISSLFLLAKASFMTLLTPLCLCPYGCMQDQLQSGRYAGNFRLFIFEEHQRQAA